MTLLTAAAALARRAALGTPTSVYSSTDRTWVEVLEIANATGEELARRVDWPQLRQSATLTGTGSSVAHDMPADFMRVSPGAAVLSGASVVRKVSGEEWRTLTAEEGAPRYYYLGVSDTPATYPAAVSLWPYLANAETVTLNYQSGGFCAGGSSFTADDDAIYVDEELFVKGMLARWLRQKGLDYMDWESEYEASLRDWATAYGGL